MIEIYFGKRIVYLTDEKQSFYAKFKDRKQLKDLIYKFDEGSYDSLYITSNDLNDLFQNFKSILIFETAAGGLVINPLKKILAIKNRNIWQLPKGHIEEGETISEAAIREVSEEAGIGTPIIIEHLPSTFHTFKKNGKLHLKQTYWFKMLYNGIEKPTPQISEGITEATWINKSEIIEIKNNTYDNLVKIWDYT
ncbi:MAG: NUDIX domain-containing protein [Bacteroidales bacterium]|nr:NUDIX domain-containing protein [Bacteroidales bacterium]